jgi:hypothetical protein
MYPGSMNRRRSDNGSQSLDVAKGDLRCWSVPDSNRNHNQVRGLDTWRGHSDNAVRCRSCSWVSNLYGEASAGVAAKDARIVAADCLI